MEPKLPAQERRPELPSVSYGQNLERAPIQSSPEVAIERAPERFEQRSEAAPAAVSQAPVLPPVVVPPAIPAPVVDEPVQAPADDMPVVANDDDLIEREWVDKAKKIITETKDDPYRREQEVGKLQVEYLRKRYGRELGAPQ